MAHKQDLDAERVMISEVKKSTEQEQFRRNQCEKYRFRQTKQALVRKK